MWQDYGMITPSILHLHDLPVIRDFLTFAEFRIVLRQYLLDHPQVTLCRVAAGLGITRQRVSALVGPLGRPTCCTNPDRWAPEREKTQQRMAELNARVAVGESAEKAAGALGVSLPMARVLGFRVKAVRPPHGQGRQGCNCWRCRRAAGVAARRGPRIGEIQKAEVCDWLAWADPEDGRNLTQAVVGRLVGVRQTAVSRIARAAETF